MKRAGTIIRGIVFVCFVIGFALAVRARADAASWYLTHGHGASVQDENNTAIVETCIRKGNALELHLAHNAAVDFMTTWVHFAVPTISTGARGAVGARYLSVRVNMVLHGAYSSIPMIRVYNGETLVKEFELNYRVAGWNTIPLDLGAVKKFSKGLCISVQVSQDFNAVDEYFLFSGAGAYFVP